MQERTCILFYFCFFQGLQEGARRRGEVEGLRALPPRAEEGVRGEDLQDPHPALRGGGGGRGVGEEEQVPMLSGT